MKTMKLIFTTAGKSNYELTVKDPKEDLTLDTVKTEAAKLVPVLVNKSGAEVTGFLRAVIISTTETELS